MIDPNGIEGNLGGGNVAVFCGWHDTTEGVLVEDQHSRTTLQPGVSSLALPVSVTGFSKSDVSIRIVIAESCKNLKLIIDLIIQKIISTYGAFGIPRHSRASRNCGRFRCTTNHLCRAAPWLFRSNRSSIGCSLSHGQRFLRTIDINIMCLLITNNLISPYSQSQFSVEMGPLANSLPSQ